MLQLRRCPRCESHLEENNDIFSTHQSCFQCGYLYVGNGYFDDNQKPITPASNIEGETAARIRSVVRELQAEKFVKSFERTHKQKEAESPVSTSYSGKTGNHINAPVTYADLMQSTLIHPRIPTWIGADTLMGSVRKLKAISEVIRIRSEKEGKICI